MKAIFKLSNEQILMGLNSDNGLNFTLNGEPIKPVIIMDDVEWDQVVGVKEIKILITEDNIDDVKVGDTVVWESLHPHDNHWAAVGRDLTLGKKYLVDDIYMESNYIRIIDDTEEGSTPYAYGDGAICYKIIKEQPPATQEESKYTRDDKVYVDLRGCTQEEQNAIWDSLQGEKEYRPSDKSQWATWSYFGMYQKGWCFSDNLDDGTKITPQEAALIK